MKMRKFSFPKFQGLAPLAGKEMVCLNLSNDRLKLGCIRIAPTKRELIDLASYEVAGLSDDEIARTIKTFIDNLKLKSPEIIVVVPAHLAITKNIEIPSQDPQEITEIIDLQAGRHTPHSREEILIDYIGTPKKNYTQILLIIVILSTIRHQIELIEKAGFKTEKVLFAPEAIGQVCAMFINAGREAPVQAFVHVDLNFSEFLITANGKMIFVRSIPIGTEHLLSEKERYEPRFIEEVRKSLEAYQAEDIDTVPNELILTGPFDAVSALRDVLTAAIPFPVKSFYYLEHLPIISESLKERVLGRKRESFLDVAAPLMAPGLIKVSLLPEEIKLRKLFAQKSEDLVKTGVFVTTVLMLLCGILLSQIYFKNAYAAKLEQKYAPVIEKAEVLDEDFARMRLIKNYLEGRDYPLEVLAELYRLIPMDVQLTGIRFSMQGQFSIEGKSKTMAIVFAFISQMEESSFFKNVESRRTTKRQEGEEELVDFEIICLLAENSKL